jgi:hypothetical protein
MAAVENPPLRRDAPRPAPVHQDGGRDGYAVGCFGAAFTASEEVVGET